MQNWVANYAREKMPSQDRYRPHCHQVSHHNNERNAGHNSLLCPCNGRIFSARHNLIQEVIQYMTRHKNFRKHTSCTRNELNQLKPDLSGWKTSRSST